MASFPEIEKLSGTVKSIVDLANGISKYSITELNQAEERLRNEFQVIEAHLFYVGQEFYSAVQARRIELKKESRINSLNALEKVKEKNGSIRTNGDTGGSDKPGRSEQEGNTKAKRPSRQSKSKK